MKVFFLTLGGLIGGLLLIFLVGVAFGLMQLPWMNIQRQVTTHSQQYVQTHQTMMLDFLADYERGDEPHKAAATLELCQEAALLDRDQWPVQAEAFISTHCQ